MIPRITAGGRSFKGAFSYYLHDKERTTRERVAWTETDNLLTDDPDKAWKVMAYTAKEAERLKEASGLKMTGRKLTKPVFAYSLSWHPEQRPDKAHMLATARKTLDLLGLTEHETVFIAHRDEPQQHVHVVVNRVHPVTGLAGATSNSQRKLSEFALQYEREHGKIYCRQREENQTKRQQGQRVRYCDPVIAEAWRQSDSGRSFAAALRTQGYHLALGRTRLVVVDRYGQSHNPVRHLENVRARQFQERLGDMDRARLPEATALSRRIQADNRRRYQESLRHDARVVQQRNELQSRHEEQRSQVSDHYQDRLHRQREDLNRYYRLDEQEARIDALRRKARSSPWWERWLGITRARQERLRELERNRRNAEWRAEEKLGQTAEERERKLARLKAQQETEERRKLERWEVQKPAGYLDAHERKKVLQQLEDKRRAAVRSSPKLNR